MRATQLTDADLVWYGDLVLWTASQTGLPLSHVADEILIELREIPCTRARCTIGRSSSQHKCCSPIREARSGAAA